MLRDFRKQHASYHDYIPHIRKAIAFDSKDERSERTKAGYTQSSRRQPSLISSGLPSLKDIEIRLGSKQRNAQVPGSKVKRKRQASIVYVPN